MAKILIAGCGSLGLSLAHLLAQQGHNVTGLKRTPPENSSQLHFFRADITHANALVDLATDFEHVFFILAPEIRPENRYESVYGSGLNNLIAHFSGSQKQPAWIFVSSTSVYSQNQGEWIDENTLAEPDNANSLAIRKAEQRLLSLIPESTIVRFSGIYGPGREYLLRSAQSSPKIQETPPYYTNRIHQDDCVGVLAFLLEQRLKGITLDACYLASDDHPATQWEVVSWLAEQLKCPLPEALTLEENSTQNKRCVNQRLKALGYSFIYPSYKEGYGQLIRSI